MGERIRQSDDVLSFLVGHWRGRGVVTLPSVPPREYEEQVRFERRSERSLDYWQRAIDRDDGAMLHSESGIWRLSDGRMEVSIALPGATEISEGSVTDREIVLTSTAVARASTGAPLVATARRYAIRNDGIAYDIEITTDRSPASGHLRGALRRHRDADRRE